MSQEIKVTGMVLQAGNIGEYDKRIVLLTKERGRISAFARGAKKATSQYAAACQPFTFGEFSLYEGKNSFNLMWAGVDNYFDTLKKDLDLIYYASYFCELAFYGIGIEASRCVKCGKTKNLIWFDAKECGVVCKDCEHGKVKVSPSTLYTLQYIMYSSIQKLYTFKVSDDVLWELKKIIREYMRYHIDHEFKSLVFL